ncbi:MAG: hypothetical protein AAF741_19185 [Bacteroidota bacterium]
MGDARGEGDEGDAKFCVFTVGVFTVGVFTDCAFAVEDMEYGIYGWFLALPRVVS